MWKERVEGLDNVEKVMNSAMNITPNLGSDFQASMKVGVLSPVRSHQLLITKLPLILYDLYLK